MMSVLWWEPIGIIRFPSVKELQRLRDTIKKKLEYAKYKCITIHVYCDVFCVFQWAPITLTLLGKGGKCLSFRLIHLTHSKRAIFFLSFFFFLNACVRRCPMSVVCIFFLFQLLFQRRPYALFLFEAYVFILFFSPLFGVRGYLCQHSPLTPFLLNPSPTLRKIHKKKKKILRGTNEIKIYFFFYSPIKTPSPSTSFQKKKNTQIL